MGNLYVLDAQAHILMGNITELYPVSVSNPVVDSNSNNVHNIDGDDYALMNNAIRKYHEEKWNGEISDQMKRGVKPPRSTGNKKKRGGSGLILTHGFCTNENPWAYSPEDFTDAEYFLDPDANRSNDEFAEMLGEFGDSFFDSFGIIGHSQGGLAATTLLQNYWSGLDESTGGRVIQSVGSPYLGNSASGSTADLGAIFGILCGSQEDLTREGAERWVATIDEDTQKQVYYYTTQYQTGGIINYCNLPMNALLQWPNDGLMEFDYGHLPNANDMGHTKGQCHSLEMEWPAQFLDNERNVEMNSEAAR